MKSHIYSIDQFWMMRAYLQAKQAMHRGEIPVGAVLVTGQRVLAEGGNATITQHDATAHAEIVVLRKAGEVVKNYRLVNTTLYVTLEPCPMCAGALVHARVKRLVFATADLKTGSAGSIMNLVEHAALNHQLELCSGVLEQPCADLLSGFFRQRRLQHKRAKQQAKLQNDI